jgi:hypothetical protein
VRGSCAEGPSGPSCAPGSVARTCVRLDDATTALTAALDDPEFLVRYHAVESLGAIGDDAVLRRLAQLLEDPPDRAAEGAARSAARAISGRLGIEIALPEPRWPPLDSTWADD